MERGLAYFLAIRSRLSAHVRHAEDEERIVRRVRHAISDGEDRPGTARDARFLLHFALNGLDNGLARLDVSRRDRPEAFRRAVRLSDHKQLPVADQERARADRDRERRKGEGHGPGQVSDRDGFISGLVPLTALCSMARTVWVT